MKRSRHRRLAKPRKEENSPFFTGKESTTKESSSKGAFFQAKLKISDPSDASEKEADRAADRVVRNSDVSTSTSAFGGNSVQRQEKKEEAAAKRIQRQAEKEEEPAAKRIQRQAEKEEEPAAKLIDRQAEEEEEAAAKHIQREAEMEEEPAAKLIQREAEKEEEPAAKLIHRQAEEEEEAAAKHIQREAEKEEEPAAKLIQREAEKEEEPAAKLIHRQAEQEEEPAAKLIQREAEKEEEPAAKLIQRKEEQGVGHDTMQINRKDDQVNGGGAANGMHVQAKPKGESTEMKLEKWIQETKGMGMQLPKDVRAEMEGEFKMDFSKVRIHIGETAEKMTDMIKAHAFTHGYDIYFNMGRYQPYSTEGKRLLAHELAHVVQQKG